MQNLRLSTSSVFEEARKQFNKTSHASRLQEKYRIKPYFEKFASLRLVVLFSSFFFNIFSAATASTFVFLFASGLLQNVFASGIFTFVVLLLLEALKRLVTPSFFKDVFQFGFSYKLLLRAVFVLFLASSSVALSFYGAKQIIHKTSHTKKEQNLTPIKEEYNSRIKTLEAKQEDIKRHQSWKGTLTRKGQTTYQKIEDQIHFLTLEHKKEMQEATKNNNQNRKQEAKTTNLKAEVFAIVTLVTELLFLLSIWFLELYDFRSFKEFASFESSYKEEDDLKNSVATRDNTETLDLAIKKAKANISAYKSKLLKGEGKTSTNQEGLQRWKNKLQMLESQLV